METIKKYLSIILMILLFMVVLYAVYVKSDRDDIRVNLNNANEQIIKLANVNKELNGVIDLLQTQSEQDRQYITDLEFRKKESEEETSQLENDFKRLKNENKAINTWANDKLPSGLY